jgi:hypothetical protein
MNAETFICDYSIQNYPLIQFAWNGKHADDFVDSNYDFRKEVLEIVCSRKEAPILLVRDLFVAETEWAKQAWCVEDDDVRELAQQLLDRGKQEFAIDFLRGKAQCFDTAMCCATVKIDKKISEAIVLHLRNTLRTIENETDKTLILNGIEFFSTHINE